MLLMFVCIVLIWFLLTSLQEAGNLEAIFKVRRKEKNTISKLVLAPTPSPPFWSKAIILNFFITLPYPTLGLYCMCTVDMISLSLLYMIALTVEKYCLDIPCVL